VPLRGSATAIIADVMGGIRSGLTYCGATDIRGLQRKAQFMEVSRASFDEGTPHALGRLVKERGRAPPRAERGRSRPGPGVEEIRAPG